MLCRKKRKVRYLDFCGGKGKGGSRGNASQVVVKIVLTYRCRFAFTQSIEILH